MYNLGDHYLRHSDDSLAHIRECRRWKELTDGFGARTITFNADSTSTLE